MFQISFFSLCFRFKGTASAAWRCSPWVTARAARRSAPTWKRPPVGRTTVRWTACWRSQRDKNIKTRKRNLI